MPAASFQHNNSAGRSKVILPNNSSNISSPVGSKWQKQQLSLSTSLATHPEDECRAGANSSSSTTRSYQRNSGSRGHKDTNMSSYSSTTTVPSAPRSASGYAKLHKRGGSGSSLPGPHSPFTGAHSQFATPFATYEEPLLDMASLPSTTPTPKIKPYLRKISNGKDDQGKIDLSKSAAENDRLAGLGIQDAGTRSASDVTFTHVGRRATHARTTSVGSQMSTGSGSFRPTQPFVHPMRQTPRPYTPPTGSANASFVKEDEADESDDVIDDDFRLGHGFRSKRSMSIPSTPALVPTPLSQTHTAEDLGLVPKLTSPSQTNLSVKSSRSGKSSKSRLGRIRRNTERSFDVPTSPSSRTSIDKAFSFVSRKSDPDPETRDDRIRAARRKFEEKEASKSRRSERDALKRRETDDARSVKKQERQRRKSEASEQIRVSKSRENDSARSSPRKGKKDEQTDEEKFHSRGYDEYRPANRMSLPRQGHQAGASEKTQRAQERKSGGAQSGWVRFSAWLQTRLLSCGGGRR